MDNYFQQLKLYFQLKYIYIFDTEKIFEINQTV